VTDEAGTRQHAWTVASWRDGAWCAACGAAEGSAGPCRPAEATALRAGAAVVSAERLAGMRDALIAVGMLEPREPAIDAAKAAIASLIERYQALSDGKP
jgi:hypothetical protein